MSDDVIRRLTLLTPPDDVDAVHHLLEQVWAEHGGVSAVDRHGFETALIELASNVIRHAGDGGKVECEVVVRITPTHIEASLHDSGDGGDVALATREMPAIDAEGGRGIPLINALVDTVRYGRDGDRNVWTISRRLRG